MDVCWHLYINVQMQSVSLGIVPLSYLGILPDDGYTNEKCTSSIKTAHPKSIFSLTVRFHTLFLHFASSGSNVLHDFVLFPPAIDIALTTIHIAL